MQPNSLPLFFFIHGPDFLILIAVAVTFIVLENCFFVFFCISFFSGNVWWKTHLALVCRFYITVAVAVAIAFFNSWDFALHYRYRFDYRKIFQEFNT